MIKLNLSFKNDATRENFAPPDENGLAEYDIDNDMEEYQRRAYNNWKSGSESHSGLSGSQCRTQIQSSQNGYSIGT